MKNKKITKKEWKESWKKMIQCNGGSKKQPTLIVPKKLLCYGLSPTDTMILTMMLTFAREESGKLLFTAYQGDLANCLCLEKPTLANHLNTLCDSGLIRKNLHRPSANTYEILQDFGIKKDCSRTAAY